MKWHMISIYINNYYNNSDGTQLAFRLHMYYSNKQITCCKKF